MVLNFMIKICIEVVRMDWWYTAIFLLIIYNLDLELCCDWCDPHMMAVLCEWCGLVGFTLCIMMIMTLSANYLIYYNDFCSWFMSSIIISIYMWLLWKYVFPLLLLGYHIRLWLCPFVCSLTIDAWLFVLDYMSLWWLYLWCYTSLQMNYRW